MKGDIAVAGFMLTAEEWEELDAASRAQLVAVITRREAPRLASGTGPITIERMADTDADGVPAVELDGAETAKYR